MNKTRVVRVVWAAKHPRYRKTILQAKKFKAHDEKNSSRMGDVVKIMETRPLSKDKNWLITEILKKNDVKISPLPEEISAPPLEKSGT
jgi:small subunit ribosomal protein S17